MFYSFIYKVYSFFLRVVAKGALYKLRSQLKYCGKNVIIDFPFNVIRPQYISIGDDVRIGARSRIEAVSRNGSIPEIQIGNNVTIEPDFHLGAYSKIEIEEGVLIAGKVYVGDHYHGFIDKRDIDVRPSKRELTSKGPIIIQKYAWIGENVSIVGGGITIGKNSIVGANAVVTRDVPDSAVVGGIPAKVIKKL